MIVLRKSSFMGGDRESVHQSARRWKRVKPKIDYEHGSREQPTPKPPVAGVSHEPVSRVKAGGRSQPTDQKEDAVSRTLETKIHVRHHLKQSSQ
jgi:hypothetical protein